ncbi:MAG: hypothetical protein IJK51_02000 [Bacteroidaceae bacterium]|nr:hypothetical protein [Bacteroidaceae bacterium]
MSPPDGMVDSVIEPEEWFFAFLQAAWDDGGAKQNPAILTVIYTIPIGKTDIRGFQEERHLATEMLAIHYIYMISPWRDLMQGVLTGVAYIFTTDGESACGGKLPYVASLQKYFHGFRM